MKYFFVLGNNPTLSVAEISAVFCRGVGHPLGCQTPLLVNKNICIFKADKKIIAQELIKKLGGTIKIGAINSEIKSLDIEKIKKQLIKIIDKKEKSGKFKFGFSYYGNDKLNLKTLGMETKKHLKEQGISCRWVTGRDRSLSSVIVEQNKLTSSGIELNIFPLTKGEHKGVSEVLIGQTLAVQPFKELSFRDYGRPARDDHSGMLPPKLAQIMINLAVPHPNPPLIRGGKDSKAGQGGVILDPFCGSGTILTEAMLMGYKNIIGSDNSKKAIEDTEKNINWIKKNYQLSTVNYQLYNKSAAQLSQILKPNTINAIITEPYLGPQRGKLNLKKIIPELKKLYSASLKEFKKILKPHSRIVIIFPVFRTQNTSRYITPNLNGFKVINPIPASLQNNKLIKLTNRQTIIYGREGQKVWREIVILDKINKK